MAFLCSPALVLSLLLGSPLDTSAEQVLGRLAGAALLALGLANYYAYYDAQSAATKGLVVAMVAYNLGAVFVLGTAGFVSKSVGLVLWPAVILHTVMTAWCLASLSKHRVQTTE